MLFSSAFTVFVLGLRHGADPDHLAAIDNLTRNAIEPQPRLSRFCGTLFAAGHTLTVLAIAVLLGYAGRRLSAHAHAIETAGTITSIAVLLWLAALNVRQLMRGGSDRPASLRAHLLPSFLRNATSAWAAIPIGILFGFGFETSSQIAAYALVFGVEAGALGAALVGGMFCAGMTCTDTFDSLFVHGMVSYRDKDAPRRLMRVWLWVIALCSIGVAVLETCELCANWSPISDAAASGIVAGALVVVFAWILVARERHRALARASSS